jgi:hypothetical protein
MRADTVTFFGEDLNNSPTTRIAHPNADAARVSFLANLTGVGTETFEGFAAGTAPPLALTFPGAGTATLNGDWSTELISISGTGTNGFGRYPISGNKYWEADTNAFSIDFSTPISAFGFYGVDIGDFGGTVILTMSGGMNKILNVPNTMGSNGSIDGSVLYFGFYDTSNSFTKITFGNTNTDDVFAFDDMTIGTLEQIHPQIPEPASLFLMGTGLLVIASRCRKR